MLMRLIVRLLINAVALAAAAWAVPGILFEGYGSLALMALVFGIVNALIRPIVMVMSCPLLIVTLGLFTFVINAVMLKVTSLLVKGFDIEGFLPALWGTIVLSIVSGLLNWLVRDARERRRED